jgi:hypothetical protein
MSASSYTEELAAEICERIADGESLRSICALPGMPHRSTVLVWLSAYPDFQSLYAQARVAQADYMDDLILETANSVTPETAHAAKVKISAYQWRAAKLKPKVYGERLEVEQTVRAVVLDEPPTEDEWLSRTAKHD